MKTLQLIGIIIILIFSSCTNSGVRIAYVKLNYLFENFNYTIELRDKLSTSVMRMNRELDSLNYELETMEHSIPKVKKNQKMLSGKKIFLSELSIKYNGIQEKLTRDYDAKILTQLNSYLRQYGDENSLQMIIGDKDDGRVLYAEPNLNITEDVLTYINDRYEGIK